MTVYFGDILVFVCSDKNRHEIMRCRIAFTWY